MTPALCRAEISWWQMQAPWCRAERTSAQHALILLQAVALALPLALWALVSPAKSREVWSPSLDGPCRLYTPEASLAHRKECRIFNQTRV